MMKKLYFLVIITTILIVFAGCSNSSAESAQQIPNNYKTYNEAGIFSISYPEDWVANVPTNISNDLKNQLLDNIKSGSIVPMQDQTFLFGAYKTPTAGEIWPRLGVYVFPAEFDLDKLINAEKKEANNGEITSSLIMVNGRNATLLDLTSINPEFHHIELCVISGKNIWYVGCQVGVEDYSKWSKDLNNIVHSFKLGN